MGLKASEQTRDIPVIFISALDEVIIFRQSFGDRTLQELRDKNSFTFESTQKTKDGREIGIPDISVFRWERIPRTDSGRIANRFKSHPDWAIEILSPEQSQTKILRNLLHCCKNGTELGWLILPDEAGIFVVHSNQRIELLETKDLLPVLSHIDLSLTVEQVFSWLNI